MVTSSPHAENPLGIRFGRRRSSKLAPLRPSEDAVRLAARLKASLPDSHKSLVFTGWADGDAVTTVATEVALALAWMNEGDILLVDANCRRPRLHERFDVEQIPGFSELITGKASIESAIHVSDIPSLSCLPAGDTAVDPIPLFSSTGCADLIQELRTLFRFTIFDSSPILESADTALVASRTDGAVMVAAAGQRRRSEIREVKELLGGLRINLIGVVLSEKSRGLFGSRFRPPS